MTTRELFQTKKTLRNWWMRVIEDPQFAEVLLHARSEFIEAGPSEVMLKGARDYEIILTSLAVSPPGEEYLPSPGIHHEIEPEPPEPGVVNKPKKAKK